MTGERTVQEEEIPPRPSVLVESLRDIGYSLQTAVADVIDNSLTAGARRIGLFADTHAEAPAIGILDNGTGMTATELRARPCAREAEVRSNTGSSPTLVDSVLDSRRRRSHSAGD